MQFIAAFFGQRQTDQAAAFPSHEINFVSRDHFRRAHQITLVLAVLIVDDNNHSPIANISGGIWNGSERHVLDLRSRIWTLEFGFDLCYRLPSRFGDLFRKSTGSI